MSDSNSQHGPRLDDALDRAARSDVQAGRATRAQEWRDPEPSGEDQPEVSTAPAGWAGSAEPAVDPDAVELRSDLARHLDRNAFPGDRDRLVGALAAHQAPLRLAEVIRTLPRGKEYGSLHDVLAELGLTPEADAGAPG